MFTCGAIVVVVREVFRWCRVLSLLLLVVVVLVEALFVLLMLCYFVAAMLTLVDYSWSPPLSPLAPSFVQRGRVITRGSAYQVQVRESCGGTCSNSV